MKDRGKYNYLQVKENYFDQVSIRYLESIQDGYLYINVLMKLQLISLKHKGKLISPMGVPYTSEELAYICRTPVGVIEHAQKEFLDFRLAYFDENGVYCFPISDFIGSSSDEADKVRAKRHKKKELAIQIIGEEMYNRIPKITKTVNRKRYGGHYFEVCERDNHQCCICQTRDDLCIHHIDGYESGYDKNNAMNKLILVCKRCHSKIHNDMIDIPEKELKRIGYYERTDDEI